ncbi:MAG TPA: hypothetical protein PKD53_11945 [Chloroflexaceae bacterium]|nr:hypothetical protein [Chloroflexaceae bacterium]
MGDERRHQCGEGGGEQGPRRAPAGGLLSKLRRMVAPRGPAVLVMEPDGRLVSGGPGAPRPRRD